MEENTPIYYSSYFCRERSNEMEEKKETKHSLFEFFFFAIKMFSGIFGVILNVNSNKYKYAPVKWVFSICITLRVNNMADLEIAGGAQ